MPSLLLLSKNDDDDEEKEPRGTSSARRENDDDFHVAHVRTGTGTSGTEKDPEQAWFAALRMCVRGLVTQGMSEPGLAASVFRYGSRETELCLTLFTRYLHTYIFIHVISLTTNRVSSMLIHTDTPCSEVARRRLRCVFVLLWRSPN